MIDPITPTQTTHIFHLKDSRRMKVVKDQSVNLILTSPPYPMVQMWDDLFKQWDVKVKRLLLENKASEAFERMHLQLDVVWKESFRVLKEGGILVINIGDATRSFKQEFQLFSNHSRILQSCHKLGFNCLPDILWRKQTNSPTKFMGSGMFPVGAYVTYEHEYILIFRKGSKRIFSKAELELRRESAFFWEERNKWFSDIWEIKGEKQIVKGVGTTTRNRTAAFPLEFAYRLVNMLSIKGDIVLDPFVGTGTTSLAAVLTARNSIGFDIDSGILEIGKLRIENSIKISSEILGRRWREHADFIARRIREGKNAVHINENYNIGVVTAQERTLKWESVHSVDRKSHLSYTVNHVPFEPKKGKNC